MGADVHSMTEEFVLKVRIRFRKYSIMKYIGHLDILRYFQKCMRRAEIDISYSGGFSPHQIMSFAAPLGVGLISDGEYLDISVESSDSSKVSMEKLNSVMVPGIKITSYKKLDDKDKNAMSIVACADYYVYPKERIKLPSVDKLLQAKKDFYDEAKTILVTKQTKKSEKVMDLKALVYDFDITTKDINGIADNTCFYIKLSTGSVDNVKPELFLKAFFDYMGVEFVETDYQIHRLDLYCDRDGELISLSDTGEEIE